MLQDHNRQAEMQVRMLRDPWTLPLLLFLLLAVVALGVLAAEKICLSHAVRHQAPPPARWTPPGGA